MFLQKVSTNSTDLSLQCIWSHICKILQEKLVLFMLYSLVHCRLSLVARGKLDNFTHLTSHKPCDKVKGWPEDKWGQGHWVWAAAAASRKLRQWWAVGSHDGWAEEAWGHQTRVKPHKLVIPAWWGHEQFGFSVSGGLDIRTCSQKPGGCIKQTMASG